MGTPASSLGWFSNGGRGLSFTDVDSSYGRRTWSVPISFQYFFLLLFLSELHGKMFPNLILGVCHRRVNPVLANVYGYKKPLRPPFSWRK